MLGIYTIILYFYWYKNTLIMYGKSGTLGLFSEENRLEKLSRQGDPLERLDKVVDWEYFREVLEKGVPKKVCTGRSRALRPCNDVQDFDPATLL